MFLRSKGAVRVALITPYGATKSDFFAVGSDHKLDSKWRPIPGNVGHDRIQQGRANESIGEAIRRWHCLPAGDFQRIDVDLEVRDDAFYLTPLKVHYAKKSRDRGIRRIDRPLTFTHDYQSPFWMRQIAGVESQSRDIRNWALGEICRVMRDHRPESRVPHVQEQDLLRASGPLKHLGVALGAYVGKGYDCLSEFSFLRLPPYTAPVEIKKRSQAFRYQEGKYGKDELSRAVILCATHDHGQLPPHIDVIELDALCAYANRLSR